MSTFRIPAALAAFLLLMGCVSCDGLRKLAGRPTSAELAEKQAMIDRAAEDRHRSRLDSLAKVEKSMADSLAILDSLGKLSSTILGSASVGGINGEAPSKRYSIVIGSFSMEENALRLKSKAEAAGYGVSVLKFRNGFNSVVIEAGDNLKDAHEVVKKVKSESFCPSDVWVLVNE